MTSRLAVTILAFVLHSFLAGWSLKTESITPKKVTLGALIFSSYMAMMALWYYAFPSDLALVGLVIATVLGPIVFALGMAIGAWTRRDETFK